MDSSVKGKHVLGKSTDSGEPPKKKVCSTADTIHTGEEHMDIDKDEVGNWHHQENKPHHDHKQMSPSELEEFRKLMRQRQKAAMVI